MSVFTDFALAYEYLNKFDNDIYKLRNKLHTRPKEFSIEDARELDSKYASMERRYMNLCSILVNKLPEVSKLEAENDFMLRLINEHRIAE